MALPGAAPPLESGGSAAPRVPRWSKVVARGLDALAVLLIAFAVWKFFVAPRNFSNPKTSTQAPPVVLPLLAGGSFELARERGRVVFLDFWASWCEPCKLSIPLVQHYEATHPNVDVVSIDAGEPAALVRRFALGRKMRRVAFDPDMNVTSAFGVQVFPTMVVIDASGKERAKWVGYNALIESAMDHARLTLGPKP